jgi:transketolase
MNATNVAGPMTDTELDQLSGSAGHVIGMRTFGASAPLKALQEKFGFEPDRVAAAAKELLGNPLD